MDTLHWESDRPWFSLPKASKQVPKPKRPSSSYPSSCTHETHTNKAGHEMNRKFAEPARAAQHNLSTVGTHQQRPWSTHDKPQPHIGRKHPSRATSRKANKARRVFLGCHQSRASVSYQRPPDRPSPLGSGAATFGIRGVVHQHGLLSYELRHHSNGSIPYTRVLSRPAKCLNPNTRRKRASQWRAIQKTSTAWRTHVRAASTDQARHYTGNTRTHAPQTHRQVLTCAGAPMKRVQL
jgi:hypothetical protein